LNAYYVMKNHCDSLAGFEPAIIWSWGAFAAVERSLSIAIISYNGKLKVIVYHPRDYSETENDLRTLVHMYVVHVHEVGC
jgi:hypothetical protein